MSHRVMAIAFAVTALTLAGVQPAAAYYGPYYVQGTTGNVVTDKEVVCRYTDVNRLRRLIVHPPTIFGVSDQPQRVQWRYHVRQAQEFAAGPLIFKSRWYTDYASLTAGTHNLGRHVHTIPLDSTIPGTDAWYVGYVIVRWFDAAGTTEIGRESILYGSYLLKRGADAHYSNACAFDYNYVWGAE